MNSINNSRRNSQISNKIRLKFKKICLDLIFSDIGLTAAIISYIVFGSFLFQYLENDAVIQKCEAGKMKSQTFIKKYAQIIFNHISLNLTNEERLAVINVPIYINTSYVNVTLPLPNDPTPEIDIWLIELRDFVQNVSDSYKYSGMPCDVNSWIFESSILFTMTLITTIGYGHITPETWDGQIISMCYSLIGIPFFVLWISRLSQRFGDIFRSGYSRVLIIFKYIRFKCCPKRNNRKKSYINNIPLEKMELESLKDMEFDSFSNFSEDSYDNFFLEATNQFKLLKKPVKKVSIPLVIVIAIIALYIYIGSLVLNYLEGWNFLQSVYFSFISMSSIGFGDYVPGIKNFKNNNGNTDGVRILSGITYLIIGIAIMAMCYDLIQEDLFIKVTKLRFYLSNRYEEDDVSNNSAARNKIMYYIKLNQKKEEKITNE